MCCHGRWIKDKENVFENASFAGKPRFDDYGVKIKKPWVLWLDERSSDFVRFDRAKIRDAARTRTNPSSSPVKGARPIQREKKR